jgi:PII-like signaling protein
VIAGRSVRVYVKESDRLGSRPLFEAIVERLQREGFGGCAVFKGIEGFGRRRFVRTERIFELSQDLPIVIEIVESDDRLPALLAVLDEMMRSGLVTSERVLLAYLRNSDDGTEGA